METEQYLDQTCEQWADRIVTFNTVFARQRVFRYWFSVHNFYLRQGNVAFHQNLYYLTKRNLSNNKIPSTEVT